MRRRIFIRGVLSDLVAFCIVCSLLSVAVSLLPGDLDAAWPALTFAPAFAAMAAVRRKVRGPVPFLCLHAALTAWPLALPLSPQLRGMLLAAMAVSFLYSCAVRIRGGGQVELSGVVFAVGCNALLALVCGYLGRGAASFPLSALAFVMVLCYLISRQTVQVDQSLDILADTARHKLATVRRFNNAILAGFLVLVALCAVLAALLPLDRLAALLAEAALSFFRWLSGLLRNMLDGQAQMDAAASPAPDLSQLLPDAPKETPYWLRLLEEIFFFAVQAVLVIGLVAGCLYALYRLYRLFQAGKPGDGDIRESLLPQLRLETLPGFLRGLRGRLPHFGRDEGARVRRAYYRRVRRHIRRGVAVRPADTTGEIAGKIAADSALPPLTEAYNRARYSRPGED